MFFFDFMSGATRQPNLNVRVLDHATCWNNIATKSSIRAFWMAVLDIVAPRDHSTGERVLVSRDGLSTSLCCY